MRKLGTILLRLIFVSYFFDLRILSFMRRKRIVLFCIVVIVIPFLAPLIITGGYGEKAVQWVVAFGTIILAVIAIYGNEIQAKLLRPMLKLEIAYPFDNTYRLKQGKEILTIYFHFHLINTTPGRVAKNVKIQCTKIFRTDGLGNLRQTSQYIPVTFQWVKVPMHAEEGITIVSDEYCDIGYIDMGGDKFELSLVKRYYNNTGYIYANQEMLLHLKIETETFCDTSYQLHIRWNGGWSKKYEEMKENIQFELTKVALSHSAEGGGFNA